MENSGDFDPIVVGLVEDEIFINWAAAGECSGVFEFGVPNFAGPTHLPVGGQQIEGREGFRRETQAGVEAGFEFGGLG